MTIPVPGENEYTRRRCANCGFVYDGKRGCPKCRSNATDPKNKKPTWMG